MTEKVEKEKVEKVEKVIRKEKENGIRFEKKVLMGKRLVMGVAVEFSDQFYTALDRIRKIAVDSELEENYLIEFFIDQMRSEYIAINDIMESDDEDDIE